MDEEELTKNKVIQERKVTGLVMGWNSKSVEQGFLQQRGIFSSL